MIVYMTFCEIYAPYGRQCSVACE